MMGFKNDWQTDELEKVNDYINIIHDSFEAKLSVAMLRTPKGKAILTLHLSYAGMVTLVNL